MADKKGAPLPGMLKGAAAAMAADVLVILGFVFLLLGISKFLNDVVKIAGFGEGFVGIGLLVIGILILTTSKMKIRIAQAPRAPGMPMQPMPPMPQQPPKEAPSDSYR